MSGRNIYRPDGATGAHGGAYGLTAVEQGRPGSALHTRRPVRPGENAFRNADRCSPGPEPEMAGEAETARMGKAVPVAEEQIGAIAQLRPCLQHRRSQAKGKQARNIRKRQSPARQYLGPRMEIREAEHGDRGHRLRAAQEAYLDARDRGHRTEVVAADDRMPQPLLDPLSLVRRDLPRMKPPAAHFSSIPLRSTRSA